MEALLGASILATHLESGTRFMGQLILVEI
jgi:hypothetical protein